MELIIITVFVLGYLAIALEHPIKINKTASALLTGVICWALFVLSPPMESVLAGTEYNHYLEMLKMQIGLERFTAISLSELYTDFVGESLAHHLSNTAQILFFLLGAMTIVELVDQYEGFRDITDRITTNNPKKLLWLISWVSFVLSAILDNLTTSIVMVSLLRKLVPDKKTRMFFAGILIIAANAGGAWSPIGDVTTTMLWIGGQISTANIIEVLILPSIFCLLIPLIYLSFTLKGDLGRKETDQLTKRPPVKGSKTMLIVGVSALIFVPIFKTVTHLPPYMGMLLGLGVLWVVSEFINPHADEEARKPYTAAHALSRIDSSSVLFFLGILLAVSSLESMTTLHHFAEWLNETVGNQAIIITLIGILSSIVDNVPLVAASMGMYSLDVYPMDHFIWEYLAYCAGTGGSILIIGSAAGVAVMGMEKIDFIWYLKRISLIAMLGYFSGCAAYLLIEHMLGAI